MADLALTTPNALFIEQQRRGLANQLQSQAQFQWQTAQAASSNFTFNTNAATWNTTVTNSTLVDSRQLEQRAFTNYVDAGGYLQQQQHMSPIEGCSCGDCTSARRRIARDEERNKLALERAADPDWGGYKPAPEDWYSINKRRMKGEKTLLSMMDVFDRNEWFENKCIRIQYPKAHPGMSKTSEYRGRTLFLTQYGHYEFKGPNIAYRRNIWMSPPSSSSGKGKDWSYEDQLFVLIINFQMDPVNFICNTGCRDHRSRGSEAEVERMFKYGYDLRQPYIEAEKKRLATIQAKKARAELKMLKELSSCPSSLI